ncbi:DUF6458 family protein [Nocardiopsis sediminis]|uniref:DUF6458 family protein n=1 Tax=Nocardiopsis sediminis TaxID=1778267 RepID=A0ABV8FUM1_9ACTN
MGIGLGIFLIVVGAVLRYGITADIAALDLGAIGVIFMLAGAAVIVLTLVVMVTRGRRGEERPRSDTDLL